MTGNTLHAIIHEKHHPLFGAGAQTARILLVLGFALKNSHSVMFNAYLGQVWQAPLIVMLGLAFVLGVLTGVLALLPNLFRLRREAARKLREGRVGHCHHAT